MCNKHNEDKIEQEEYTCECDTESDSDDKNVDSLDETVGQEECGDHVNLNSDNENDDILDDPIIILEREKQELKNAYLRLSAETDNYRKRIQQEKETFKKIALRDVIEKLLPVIDNLERSIHATNTSNNLDTLREGIELILNQFEGVLTDAGLETIEINPGDEFDPQCCEAVMMEEGDDVEHSMTVVNVFETGRKLGGQVLRTAKVKVVKKK